MRQQNKQQSSIQFITCPVCSGTGKRQHGLACSNCAGMGLGAFYQARFFYWGLKLGKAVIKLNHLRQSFHLVLNLAAYTIGIIGLLALTWWIWQVSGSSGELGAFAFWRVKNALILTFWISLLADMFIFYRLSEEEALKQKIRQLKYEKQKKQRQLPNNWDELKKAKYINKVDVSRGFSYGAMKIIEQGFILANKSKHGKMEVMHLFFSLLQDKEVAAVFFRLNINSSKLINKIKNQLINFIPAPQQFQPAQANGDSGQVEGGQIPLSRGRLGLSVRVKEVLVDAYLDAYKSGQKKVKAINLILPCIVRDKNIAEILYDLEVDQNKIINVIEWFRINERLIKNYRIYKKMARFKPGSNMDRAYTAVATPVLNHFTYDLTQAAKWGRLGLCLKRDKEIENIFQAMESGQAGIILVGHSGVGKNTIIGGIAQLMVKEDVPKILKDKRLVELDAARLISGASPAQAEKRMLVMIDEVARAGNIILYIENIENIIGITAGEEQSLDLSEVLAGELDRKNLYCLASATNQNYFKYIEDKPLGKAMFKVQVKEPVGNQAIQIIESKIGALEQKHKVYFSYNAIAQAVKLTAKYIHDKYLPVKAINIIESIAVKVSKAKGENSMVTKEDIAGIVSDITRIPITKITETESHDLLNLEDRIHQRMINQEEAVNMIAASLRRARTQLREGKRPIANFLFLGPTGVGKTELAKTVAEVYFSKEDYMIRLDMSEYQHPDSVKKMIGDTTGTLGYLTEATRKSPFSLILLDEFEKAHPDILNLFLQIMDDGRLTDGQGRTIDFTNCIIIATSNVGAIYIQEQIANGANIKKIKQVLINEHLNKAIRPELINRFDGVIVFKPLSMENVAEIAKLMLNKIKKMLETKGISLRAEEEGVRKLAEQGFDPKFGARPLRRLLQERVENIIANKILVGELSRRDIVVINNNADVLVEKGKKYE
ncbi:MAG: ATP-dependent Clp protease ATP-binding subunit [Patescibacteria group bacterium]|nr:ATP-dependent Clp protease ATP-binding subunit [Patescibacteria group bacterium]